MKVAIALAIVMAIIAVDKIMGDEHQKTYQPNADIVGVDIMEALLSSYDKQTRPFNGGRPVGVNVSIHINRIISVSERHMQLTVDIFFRQRWQDSRLQLPHNAPANYQVRLSSDAAEKIWTPDLFFDNEITSSIHTSPVLNDFLILQHGGELSQSTRYTLALACPMKLHYFPMDTQTCRISIQSYGYSSDEIRLDWVHGRLIAPEQELLPNFHVKGFKLTSRQVHIDGKTYEGLEFHVKLSRAVGFYVIQIYLPSTLLVVISWFSLWMNRLIAERIGLGLTTVLTITTLLSSLNATAPKIPYIKAIDVYMGICFSFVFVSLLHSVAIAHKIGSRCSCPKKSRPEGCKTGSLGNDYGIHPKMIVPQGGRVSHNYEYGGPLLYMDKVARVAFPLAFVSVNAIYWGYFLYASHVD